MTKAEIVNEIAKKTGIEKSVVLSSFLRFILKVNVLVFWGANIILFLLSPKYMCFFFKKKYLFCSV